MNPTEDFLGGWMEEEIKKLLADIEEWETMSFSIYDCDFCGLGPGDCDCGGNE